MGRLVVPSKVTNSPDEILWCGQVMLKKAGVGKSGWYFLMWLIFSVKSVWDPRVNGSLYLELYPKSAM